MVSTASRCFPHRAVLALLVASSLFGCAGRPAGEGPAVVPPRPPLDVQGHRGWRGAYPENSLAGFRAAIALGVTTLELDLQATRDRMLVVHHDQRLDPDRCVDAQGAEIAAERIKDLAFDALSGIDCGSFPDPAFPQQRRVPGSRIPRLDEVLALAAGARYPVRLNIEIKMQRIEDGIPAAEFARLVVDLVERYGLASRTTIQSFHPPALLAVREIAPEISRAVLARERREYERLVAKTGAAILSPSYAQLREEDVRSFRARGVRVIPWTVNDPSDMRRLIDWGVDGIITDHPDRVPDPN